MRGNLLIAYYSHSGNTRKIAGLIQREAGGTLFEIQPKKTYPAAYNAVVEQAKREIQTGFRPDLKSMPDNIGAYDTIFVGSPNWWSTAAPPIMTLLEGLDLSNNTVVPFCTHGGGGQAHVLKDIAALCPGSTILPGFDIYGDGGCNGKAEISAWLGNMGII